MSQTGHNIGLATPFSWTSTSQVNQHVAQLAAQLTAANWNVELGPPVRPGTPWRLDVITT